MHVLGTPPPFRKENLLVFYTVDDFVARDALHPQPYLERLVLWLTFVAVFELPFPSTLSSGMILSVTLA